MVDMATVDGGTRSGVSSLSPSEHHAAISALSKLTEGSASHGVASVFGGTLQSATVSSGASQKSPTLVSGRGADTFAGGVHSGAAPAVKAIGSDTVVAGSAFAKTELSTGPNRALTADTIKSAGTTAADVKTAPDTKASGTTITMADKTSITLTGVTPHSVKPH
jgi:hypothetical protein